MILLKICLPYGLIFFDSAPWPIQSIGGDLRLSICLGIPAYCAVCIVVELAGGLSMAVAVDVGFIGFGATICPRWEFEWSPKCVIFLSHCYLFTELFLNLKFGALLLCPSTSINCFSFFAKLCPTAFLMDCKHWNKCIILTAQHTCVSSRHSQKCVTLLKLMKELTFFFKLLEHLFSNQFLLAKALDWHYT